MNQNFENNDKVKELKIVFEEKNPECDRLVSSIHFSKHKITSINKNLLNYNIGINNSKKFDKILYIIMGIIIGGTTSIGLLSNAGFSNILVSIGALSLSIPFICLIQSATYRLNVKEIISNLNNELSYYKSRLKEDEKKLQEKEYEITDKFYNLIDNKVVDDEINLSLHFERKIKKYEKPYIKVKKI